MKPEKLLFCRYRELQRKDVFFCILVVFLILTFRLATLDYPSLSDPSESRYAVMGLEMFTKGDWITPFTYKDGERIPFLGKPPLHTWLTALSFKLFGISELSARLPSFFCLILIAALLYYFTFKFFNKQLALLSFIFLPSTAVYFF